MALGDVPILQYPSAPAVSGPVEIRREGADLVVTIAPVKATRLVFAHVISMAVWLVILLCTWLLALLAAKDGAILFVVAAAALSLIAISFGIGRFVIILRVARLPASVRASRARLTVDVPTLGSRRCREWPAPLVADVSLRHAGVFPALVRFIRIQIAFADDRIESVLIPSPGGESLAVIEDNLRDALGLPVITA